jgi:arylsulfatase A-like enzyme
MMSHYPSIAMGFDQIHRAERQTGAPLSAEAVLELLTARLEEAPSPVFLWGHIMDVHDYFLRGADLPTYYDQTVREVDRQLGSAFERLDASERGRRALIVVTSDHGEGLGEGRLVHHALCHPLILPIPLIVRFPGRPPAIIDTTVGHLDLAPTILEAAGLRMEGLPGRDLASVFQSRPWPADRAFFEESHYSNDVAVSEVGMVAFPWLYSYDARLGVPLLVNLASDPLGMHNLARQGRREEAVMRALVTERLRSGH